MREVSGKVVEKESVDRGGERVEGKREERKKGSVINLTANNKLP